MTVFLTILVVLLVAFLLLLFFARRKFKNLPEVDPHEAIIQLTDKNFNHQLKNKVVLVDFWAAWCAPCKMMLPILNDVAAASDGSYTVAKVDVDSNQALAQKHSVRSIPTLIIFQNGEEVARHVGVKTKNFLLSELKRLS